MRTDRAERIRRIREMIYLWKTKGANYGKKTMVGCS